MHFSRIIALICLSLMTASSFARPQSRARRKTSTTQPWLKPLGPNTITSISLRTHNNWMWRTFHPRVGRRGTRTLLSGAGPEVEKVARQRIAQEWIKYVTADLDLNARPSAIFKELHMDGTIAEGKLATDLVILFWYDSRQKGLDPIWPLKLQVNGVATAKVAIKDLRLTWDKAGSMLIERAGRLNGQLYYYDPFDEFVEAQVSWYVTYREAVTHALDLDWENPALSPFQEEFGSERAKGASKLKEYLKGLQRQRLAASKAATDKDAKRASELNEWLKGLKEQDVTFKDG